jgi:Tfp pilus assembly protein PilF
VRSRSQGLIVAASCVIALFAAWRIVSLAIADFYADSDPARALQWRPAHPDALVRLAEKNVAGRKFDTAEALAKRALAANPLDGRAYRVLADAASARGDRERQQALIALAVQHAPRDIAARAWAAQIALERGDAAAAVAHYDRILRVAPGAQAKVFPLLSRLAATPGARDAMVSRLAEQPPWRTELLGYFASTAPTADDLPPVFEGLRARGGLSPVEIAALVGRFVRDRRWDQAFVAWAGGLSAGQLSALGTPVNRGFEEQAPASGPFEWKLGRVSGVDAGIRPSPDGQGHALRIEFQGRRSAFRDVRQLLLLPPRGYQLRWRSRFDGLQAARGLRWTVTCADGTAGVILATEPSTGSSPWRTHAVAFDVPTDCPAQWLTLELDARIAAETQAMGTAWFDDVEVVSRDAGKGGLPGS